MTSGSFLVDISLSAGGKGSDYTKLVSLIMEKNY